MFINPKEHGHFSVDEKTANYDWWAYRLLMDHVVLSPGIKSFLAGYPRPEPKVITDREMAAAVHFLEDPNTSFLPSGVGLDSCLYYVEGCKKSVYGPFTIACTLSYNNGNISFVWMLSDCANNVFKLGDDLLVKKLVFNLHIDEHMPFSEQFVSLPIPKWIENPPPYFCLEREYNDMVRGFIESVIDLKPPHKQILPVNG